MKALAKTLAIVGGFSLAMTLLHLWRVGFPRLEGPEGESWGKVISILASYAVMALVSGGLIMLSQFLARREDRRTIADVKRGEIEKHLRREASPIRPGFVSVLGNEIAASIGIEPQGGVFVPLLDTGKKVPCDRHEVLSTAADEQDSIEIRVFQGVGKSVVENAEIGTFWVMGIPPQPSGEPKVDVCFTVAVDGAFSVHAKDVNTAQDLRVVWKFADPEQPAARRRG